MPKASERDFVSLLEEKIGLVLGPHLPPGARCALIDFKNSSNVGDSVIWLGQTRYLRKAGVSVVYACDIESYSEEQLRARLDGGIILISGGGNLGDLYPPHQKLREQIIERFHHNKIIQLPQSVTFRDKTNLERARPIFDSHPDLTLLARDKRSLEIAGNEFRAKTELCPDMAFALGNLSPSGSPDSDVLWLGRSDDESSDASPTSVAPPGVVQTDWVNVPPGSSKPGLRIRATFRAHSLLTGLVSDHPGMARWLSGPLSATFEPLAQQRLERGRRILSKGRVIITDRLHAHILGVLMGIPQVLMADRYGKVPSFYETWTRDCSLTSWANSGDEAVDTARSVARVSAR
jgi:exopolysaccharide biosynthesis predicted pyruvyltransferase EpsI